jgi:hypothetical protein
MFSQRACQALSFLLAPLLLASPASAYESSLSSEQIREAYFLGQRRDEKTALFFETYRQHFPAPKCGAQVATVELSTPYAETVEISRQRSAGYSAQQAEQEYRQRGNTVRLAVYVRYTAALGYVNSCAVSERSGSRPDAPQASVPAGSWKDYQVRLSQAGKTLEPGTVRYEGTRITGRGGSWPTGFIVWLDYDARSLSSDDAFVEVDAPDGQHITAAFDLSKLR